MAIRWTSSFGNTLAFSDVTATMALAAATPLSFTVPGTGDQKFTVLFEYASNSNVFVGNNVTAAVPNTGTIGATRYIEFKPACRYAIGGDVLSFITPDTTAFVGISIRSIPN